MTWQDRRDQLVKNCLEIFKLTTYKGPLNSFQNGFSEGFTAGRKDTLEEMKVLVEALDETTKYLNEMTDNSEFFDAENKLIENNIELINHYKRNYETKELE